MSKQQIWHGGCLEDVQVAQIYLRSTGRLWLAERYRGDYSLYRRSFISNYVRELRASHFNDGVLTILHCVGVSVRFQMLHYSHKDFNCKRLQ